MTRACHMAVRSATGDVFSDAEIDDFLDRLTRQAQRAGKADPTLSERDAVAQAAKTLTGEQLLASLTQKRLEVMAAIARDGRAAKLAALPKTMTEAEKLDALNVGSEKQGIGTSSSVDATGRALQMTLWGKIDRGIAQMPGLMNRLANPFGLPDRGFELLVRKEVARINGDGKVEPTGDEGALHAARVIASALEDARAMQNAKGAWINKLEGYTGRQTHDPGKISGNFFRQVGEAARGLKAGEGFDWTAARTAAERRAFGQWRDDITGWLDPKTFDGFDPADAPFEALDKASPIAGVLKDPLDPAERMLHAAWLDIATGRHAELSGLDDMGDFRPSASMARSVSKERVFIFKGPEEAHAYNLKYGSSSYLAGIMHQLERAARNTALMDRWGPAPEAAFDAEKQRLAQAAQARGDVQAIKKLDGYMTRARFDAVMGRADTPENMRIAQVMRTIRGWEAITKLGSIVLSKATDLPLTGHTMARAGAGFLAGYEGFFKGVLRLGSAESRRAADALDVGARSFAGHLGSQFLASDGPPGWTGWATRLMYKINAFEWFNNGVRAGGAEVYSRHLGQESDFDWKGLDIGTRETMERFGISPADWEAARAGVEEAPDGRKYFTFDHIADPDLALKFKTMVHNVLDDTVSEPRMRERAGMTRGTRPGTLQGEIMRAFFQFKGFINTIVGRHLIPAASGYAGYKPAALIAHLIVGTALAGWVSANAKLIASGKAPRGLVGANLDDTLKIWSSAMAQGGGLGLYGDFLFGEQNRFGGDFSWSQLAGPVMSDSEQVAKIARQAIFGGGVNPNTGASVIPGELIRMAGYNIPLVNLWYTRLAIDYLVLWRLQEAASPGYLQKYQDRVESQQGQHFILPPTSALAH